jgi:hypothetical protein
VSRHEDGFVGHGDTVVLYNVVQPVIYKGCVKYTLYKRIQDLGRDNRYFRCQNRWYDDDFRGSTDTDTGG